MIWKMVPICIFWCVWKERNLRCFEDLENSMEDILASFFSYFVSLDNGFFFFFFNKLSFQFYLLIFNLKGIIKI